MKFYYALVSILIGLLIILIQPGLTVAQLSGKVINTTKTQVSVSIDSKHPSFSSIIKQEANPSTNTTYQTEILANKNEVASISKKVAQAEDFLREGIQKYARGDYQGAIADYIQAIRLSPDNANTYINRGNARGRLKDHEGAIKDYTQAIRLNPDNAFAYAFRGNTRHYILKDYQGAIEDYTQTIRLNPNSPIAYRGRGDARARLGDNQGAIADYTQALQINPYDAYTRKRIDLLKAKKASFWFSAALCMVWLLSISLHEFGHAIVAYWGGDRSVKDKGYLTLNPLKYINPLISIILPGLFFLLGGFPLPGAAVYIEHRQLRNRLWQSAVFAAGPLASLLVTLLLIVLFQVSSDWNLPYWFLAALAFFISLHFLVILFNLIPIPPLDGYGIIEPWLPNQLQVQLRKFAFVWLIFICIFPWLVPSFTLFLGYSIDTLSDWLGVSVKLALDGFELFNRWYCALLLGLVGVFALIRQPQTIWNFLGFVLSLCRKYEQALAAYNKAIELQPNSHWAWLYRGSILEELGRYEEALAAYKKAIELKPNINWAWMQRGWILKNLGHYKEALAVYDKALELKADSEWFYWYGRGQVLERLKRYEEALSAYNKVVNLTAKHFLIRFKRTSKYFLVCQDRGSVLKKLSRYEEALVAYNEAIKFRPIKLDWLNSMFVSNAYRNRGFLLEKLDRYEEALAAYDKAIKLESNRCA